MSNTNTIASAAAAALAIEEALTPDPAPVLGRQPRPVTCHCQGCFTLESYGHELPEVVCLWDAMAADRSKVWVLVAIMEEEWEYAQRRYEYKRREWEGYYDQPVPETPEEFKERWLAAA